ncbi:MAG: glycosyltransferase family 2 protein [Microcoleaceae cyanobacterium]
MNAPSISVIIPTYNRRDLLQQTLNSVQQQTFKDWEAVIIDDGSNDGTQEMVQQRLDSDPRIRYIRTTQAGSGASACRNKGTAAAKGDYIIYLDSDDCLAPSALENRYHLMEQHPELDFGVFPCMVFHQQPGDTNILWNLETEKKDLDRFLARDVPWQTTSPIWRKPALEKVGLWNSENLGWDDWEYHLKAVILGLNYSWFPYPDCFWRKPQYVSLGSQSGSVEHLKSHEECLPRLQQLLSQTDRLNEERKALLRIQYFWFAEAWIDRQNLSEALRVWQRCFEQNLVDQSLYSLGVYYLKWMNSAPAIVQKITRKMVKAIGPKSLIFRRSTTLRQVEMPKFYQTPAVLASA